MSTPLRQEDRGSRGGPAGFACRRPLLLLAGALLGFAAGSAALAAAPDRAGEAARLRLAAVGPVPLEGRVLDAATGDPLAGAHIYLAGGELVAVSDGAGRFAVPGLAPGPATLRITHIAFRSATRRLRITEGTPSHLVVSLRPVRRDLSKPLEIRAQSPNQAVYRLEGEELARGGAQDVGEALAALPGVQLRAEGGAAAPRTISLRGSRPEHVQVVVDGVVLNDGAGGAVDLARIPLRQVASLEVEPTPGPGAPGGEVRITTRRASEAGAPSLRAHLEAAPQSEMGAASLTLEHGGTTLHGDWLADEGDFRYENEEGHRARLQNNEQRRWHLRLGHRLALGTGWRGRLLLAGQGSRRGHPGPLYTAPTPEAESRQRGLRGELELERGGAQTARWWLRAGAGGREREYRSPREQYHPSLGETVLHTPADQREEHLRAHLTAGRSAETRPAADGLALGGEVGLGWERFAGKNRLPEGGVQDLLAGTVQRTKGHAELQGRLSVAAAGWSLRPRLEARVAAFADRRAGSEISPELLPSLRARLAAGPRRAPWKLHLALGTAAAPPAFASRFLAESVFARGNPALEPERVRELSGGLTLSLASGPWLLSGSASGWLRETVRIIVWRRDWRGQYFPANSGTAAGRGAELGLELAGPAPLAELGAALTLQRVRLVEEGSVQDGNTIPFQPDLYGSARIALALPGQVRLTARARFASRRYTSLSNYDPYSSAGGGLEPYGVLDLQLARPFPLSEEAELELALAVDNATGSDYELVERSVMPGRTWRLRLAWRQGRR